MKVALATALAGFISTAAATKGVPSFTILRFTNKFLTEGRVDPIVSPGKTSPHVHTIMGGSAFGLSSTGEDLLNSNCSTALVKGDNSNYWFPKLYFKDPQTSIFEPVEVFYVNAYYFFQKTNDEIKAFPVGLQLISGNPSTRVVPEALGSGNLDPSKGPVNPARFTCPRSNYNPPSWPADSDGSKAGIGDAINQGEGTGFPDANCDGYASPLRADVHFPSCYNPAAGLTNYKENAAFPEDNNGKLDCPDGWIHVPKIFLEVYWDTPKFADRWTQGQGEQPFVISNGDVTGYSSHGDFMSGWDEELLQHIIDTCDTGVGGMDTCPGLFYGLNSGDCKIESPIDEEIYGEMDKLPGNNPLKGWSYGVDGSGSAPAPTTSSQASSTGKTSTEPAATQSSATESSPTEPAATESSATEPAATESSATEPATTETAVTEPAATEPATTETAATEPATTETAVTESAATETDDTETVVTATTTATTTQTIESGYTAGAAANTVPVVSSQSENALSAADITYSTESIVSLPTSVSKPINETLCSHHAYTVYKTVTVTESASAYPSETAGSYKVKREQLRRHASEHAYRHRNLHR